MTTNLLTKMERTRESFCQSVAGHQMKILQDDGGTRRHLRFQRPGTILYSFDLITWPGHLCITGDVGCYVFSRLEDMFEFFRSNTLKINPDYWGEKVLAQDRRQSILEFSAERFNNNVRIYVENAFDRKSPEYERAMKSVEKHLIDEGHTEYSAYEVIASWSDPDDTGLHFVDFWEYRHEDYTHGFLWCCFAIVWGIQQYDALIKQRKDGK